MKSTLLAYIQRYWRVRSCHKKIKKSLLDKDFESIHTVEAALKEHMAHYPVLFREKNFNKIYATSGFIRDFITWSEDKSSLIVYQFLAYLWRVCPDCFSKEKNSFFSEKHKKKMEQVMETYRYDASAITTLWILYYRIYGFLPSAELLTLFQKEGISIPTRAWGHLSPYHQAEYVFQYDDHLHYVEKTHVHALLTYCYQHPDYCERFLMLLQHGLWNDGWRTRPVHIERSDSMLLWMHEQHRHDDSTIWPLLMRLYEGWTSSGAVHPRTYSLV